MKLLLVFYLLNSFVAEASSPLWFSDFLNTNPSCNKEYLCAVGEGDNLVLALANARIEIAKFFQNKITSKTQVSSSSEQVGVTASNGHFAEWADKTITEETNEMINGIEIKNQEVVNGRTYVLLTLDRNKTGILLKEKIQELDIEDFQLFELNSRFTYPKILKNLLLIEAYLDRYNLLEQVPLTLKVKKENILIKMNKLKPVRIAIEITTKKLPAKLNHLLSEILSPLKVIIVSKKNAPRYFLRTEVIIEDQYLKVEGFKKLNIQFRLTLINSKGEVMGKVSGLSEQVARDENQAINKAIPDLKETLINNLDQLTNIKFED